ncbi:DNA polymerase III subunit gamma/tau [Clostridium sp. L2-50]|jgi:DNA polymerase-3 subunit gamma/tau|uniref:DNA polymerase III subunit gamma/tau n=1 Tax=Clostridium sp. L2-50 TaxID=411489 RepID=UPI0002EE5B93|nr:DNA polymerase III subunit gamma/tau [Clostridium sp. L2-50]UEA73911.1 DNA polymerase III subunit gamma/tau [Lachnospiraceae bacterium GAM79]UEA77088.1 DNA polymerase III subunit gamma/tau [Lachnospiraceae bacterium GAM79]
MSYMALYRKWRPDTFEEVKGQDHVVTTLKNQIINNRIGHAFLFCGTRGTGKTSIAKLFAKAVNCEHPINGSPCNECAACRAIADGSSMNVIEIDAASNNGVDNIRQIREEVQYSPSEGKYKVYIIDEVHMLTQGAFNALLKTLEEPPAYVIFILATTESHKIPITISSRCQKYEFRRISVETISDRLMELLGREQIEAEKKAVDYIAKAADGSMRDALSILDQCIAFNIGKKLTYENVLDTIGAVDIDVFARLLDCVIKLDVVGAIDLVDEVVWQGRELSRFVSEFTWFLRNVLLVKVSPEADQKLDMSAENLERLRQLAAQIDTDALIRYINIFSDTSANIKYAVQKRIVLELAVIKLCKPEMETDYSALLDRVRVLEQKLESGAAGLVVAGNNGIGSSVSEGVTASAGATVQGAGAVSQELLDQICTRLKQEGMQIGKAPAMGEADIEAASKKLSEQLKKELPEANYNELREFVEQWDIIMDGYQNITKKFLEKARININEAKDGLYLAYVQNEDNKQAIAYFEGKERMAALREHIEKVTGRQVKIELKVVSKNSDAAQEIEANDLTKINFAIQYE